MPSVSSDSGLYDVFVSFRGEDTRKNFVSHLYSALENRGITVFKDTEIERGKDIALSVNEAIERSRIALVLLSQNYASSSWCMDELVQIMECKANRNQTVIPIFYGANSKDVEESLIELEAQCGDRKKRRAWRDAWRDVSGIAGWDSSNARSDAELKEDIVKDVADKLACPSQGRNHRKATRVRNFGTLSVAKPSLQRLCVRKPLTGGVCREGCPMVTRFALGPLVVGT